MIEISQFIREMNKKWGDNSLFYLDDNPMPIAEVIPTGSLALDLALGIGGIPRGRVTELYGAYGTGKTTLCYHIIAEAQKKNLNVIFVDMENAIDISYAEKLGVDINKVLWCQPSSQEEAIDALEGAIQSGLFGLVILDSVAALSPLKEKEDDFESANVALTPRALSKFFRRQNDKIRENNVSLLLTNQIRDNIGSYFGGTVTPGGHAVKFYSSVMMAIRRASEIKSNKEVIGHTAEVDIKKNRLAPPFRSAQFDIIYGKGIDPCRDILEVAKTLGVIILKGSYYVFGDESLGQGKESAAETLQNNKDMVESIRLACFNKMGG